GILMAIAIPAYQDYTVRARVSECLNAAAPAKLAVAESTISSTNGTTLPTSNAEAGYSGFTSNYCTSVEVGASGIITIDVDEDGVGISDGTLALTLTPTAEADGVKWQCGSTGATQYAPGSCRASAGGG